METISSNRIATNKIDYFSVNLRYINFTFTIESDQSTP